ncbi:hypothetical protein K3495_g1984 [Podosphaera aphanis]|nr:hypothetical protein K3495_g1984 [Podosphaera aphanis]
MSAQVLATELGNLLQESKRKHSELRGVSRFSYLSNTWLIYLKAVEKSLEELKSLRQTPEIQFATGKYDPQSNQLSVKLNRVDLAERPNFVNPFIIACGTKNAKFTGIAIVCLQRLSVSRALPRSRLREVLEAFREASSGNLEIQLKILQALPSLLQNYAQDLQRNLIATTLNICIILQGSKNGIVSNTAAATLQQLVVSIFDKVVAEDKIAQEVPIIGEAPSENGPVQLRVAALDACEVFNDLCLLTESEKPLFLKSAGIPKTFGLELIESILINHAQIFLDHPEQACILRLRVMPFIIKSLSEKLDFAFTVRIIRILHNLLRFHLTILSSEGEMALGLLTSMLDHDTAIWKRSLCMEVMKMIFTDAALIRRIYAMYDAQQGRKKILLDLVATIVRISSENPSIIGLGQQSSIPYSNQSSNINTDQAMLEASGVPGIIGSSVSSTDPGVGISVQWSTIRVPCMEQLDKTEPPSVPGSYIYSLSLACLSGFSEGLAKFVLPLTVPQRSSKSRSLEIGNKDSESRALINNSVGKPERQASLKKNPVPINPMTLESHPLFDEIKTCASIVEQCWPAILAACSTFLYAALDTEYYRSLIRSFQKFTQVSGVLHLSTPRDAFLTTLAKAAVPSNILTSNVPSSPLATVNSAEKQSMFSNAKGLLSGESLISEKSKLSSEVPGAALNSRNLLCLRALLNLGIALGPTLDSAWRIIFGALQHADLVIFSSNKAKTASASQKNESQGADEVPSLFFNFGDEIKAVETAAVRLLESTKDFPDISFVEIVNSICFLLGKDDGSSPGQIHEPSSASRVTQPSHVHKRTNSLIMSPVIQSHEDLFALVKLSNISSINIERLIINSPDISGWEPITSKFISVSCSSSTVAPVRLKAVESLIDLVLKAATVAASLPSMNHSVIQLRLLDTLSRALQPLEFNNCKISVSTQATDIDVHRVILEGLKSILEQCGETFVNGWDIAFAIIDSVFINRSSRIDTSLKESNAITTRSAKLIRPAFNSLQLICSDFLSSLSNHCFILLIDTLYNFCTQDDDLNISLTTITFFWVLSDFISGRTVSFSLSSDFIRSVEHRSLVEMAGSKDSTIADAALWMLLLLRLTAVTTDDRLELRNSAGQTLFRIFDAYGDQLSPEAWYMCLKLVLFNLLFSIEERLKFPDEAELSISNYDKIGWYETAVVVLNGLSSLLTNYIEVLSRHSTFGKSWQELLEHFNTFLNFHIININTAVFNALRQILAKANHTETRANFGPDAIDLAWKLCSESLPVTTLDKSGKVLDNQSYLVAYVLALQEIYRLIKWKLDASHVKTMLTLLRTAIINASGTNYSADIDYLTSLQSQVLEIITMIRTDVQGVPATLIGQVAKIIELAFMPKEMTGSDSQRPTYVALSKASMTVLENLIVAHASDQEIYSTCAISESLDALATPIVLKYSFPITTKSIPPWRQATTSAVSILKSIIPIMTNSNLKDEVAQSLWSSIVKISSGVTRASGSKAAKNIDIRLDEDFDIESLLTLRELIIPALGSNLISNKTRRIYIESLFHMSLIHAPLLKELPQSSQELLSSLSHPRKGRTVDPPPTARIKMSYVCFDELISLVRLHDSSSARIKLAQAAAPYLILRSGLTLQMYIADQPLRGMMPQPLTQRTELLYILKALVDLRCEPEAVLDIPGVGSQGKKHLYRLYPLFAQAVRAAARDQEVLECLGQALDAVGDLGPGGL